jgi:hypothetical protein
LCNNFSKKKCKEKKTEKLQKNEDKNKTNGGNRPSVKW